MPYWSAGLWLKYPLYDRRQHAPETFKPNSCCHVTCCEFFKPVTECTLCCIKCWHPDEVFGVTPAYRKYPSRFSSVISEAEFAAKMSELDALLRTSIMNLEFQKMACCCLLPIFGLVFFDLCLDNERWCCPTSKKQAQCEELNAAMESWNTPQLEWGVDFLPAPVSAGGASSRVGRPVVVMKTPGAEPNLALSPMELMLEQMAAVGVGRQQRHVQQDAVFDAMLLQMQTNSHLMGSYPQPGTGYPGPNPAAHQQLHEAVPMPHAPSAPAPPAGGPGGLGAPGDQLQPPPPEYGSIRKISLV